MKKVFYLFFISALNGSVIDDFASALKDLTSVKHSEEMTSQENILQSLNNSKVMKSIMDEKNSALYNLNLSHSIGKLSEDKSFDINTVYSFEIEGTSDLLYIKYENVPLLAIALWGKDYKNAKLLIERNKNLLDKIITTTEVYDDGDNKEQTFSVRTLVPKDKYKELGLEK